MGSSIAERRKAIVTSNCIGSVNARLRKIIKTRGHFPFDEAAGKLVWLALRNITAGWTRATRDWKVAMNQYRWRWIRRTHDLLNRPPWER